MAKIFAISEFIQWVGHAYKNSCVIFTDSLSAVCLVLNYRISLYRRIISEIHCGLMKLQANGIHIYIQFITCHNGIHSNEVADKVSKAACLHTLTDQVLNN